MSSRPQWSRTCRRCRRELDLVHRFPVFLASLSFVLPGNIYKWSTLKLIMLPAHWRMASVTTTTTATIAIKEHDRRSWRAEPQARSTSAPDRCAYFLYLVPSQLRQTNKYDFFALQDHYKARTTVSASSKPHSYESFATRNVHRARATADVRTFVQKFRNKKGAQSTRDSRRVNIIRK